MAHRKTKVIVTIGPASRNEGVLEELIKDGLDVARLNFSHEPGDETTTRMIEFMRNTADKYRRNVAILQDFGGIKLRIGTIEVPDSEENIACLTSGQMVELQNLDYSNNSKIVPFPHEDILRNLKKEDRVYLVDGRIRLEVTEAYDGEVVKALVQRGGAISSHKGINIPGVRIDRPALTDKDKQDALFGIKHGVDWVGLSFIKTAEDVLYAKEYLQSIESSALLMAKIETKEAVDNIDEILKVVDGIMIARGDLSIELPITEIPKIQKMLLRKAQEAGKVVAIATQMLASMVLSPRPYVAECIDVANAVGADAILVSDETAVGVDPVEVLRVANETLLAAEEEYEYYHSLSPNNDTERMAHGACELAKQYEGAKIIAITTGGGTGKAVSMFQPKADIIVITHEVEPIRKLAMDWGVLPGGIVPPVENVKELVGLAIDRAIETGYVDPERDEHLIVTFGNKDPGIPGSTDTIQHVSLSRHLKGKEAARQESDLIAAL